MKVRALPDLVSRPLRNSEAVVSTADGAVAVILNSTGLAVLDLLDGQRTTTEVAEFLHQYMGQAELATIQEDVESVVGQLVSSGLAKPCGTDESTV